MKLKVLLVEDDPIIGRDTKKILEFIGYKVNGPFTSAESAKDANEKEKNDIYIFDVELEGEMSGIELSRVLNSKNPKPTIFVTGLLDEQTRKSALETGATSFLNKPFNERNLVNAIEMALFTKTQIQEVKAIDSPTSFFVKVNKRFIRINLDDVDFLEASGHYMVLHQGEKQFSTSTSMGDFKKNYSGNVFFQTHRSYMVNLKRVADFDDTHIYFGEKMVPISQSKQKEFRSKISII
ncbi:MAG: response regulator transcription factor [Bacteroidia bacterium]